MSKEVIDLVASDVAAALDKQFNSGPRGEFRLRMSNLGRPICQLWHDKNNSQEKSPKPTSFILNMMIGDIVEAVFKGVLRQAGITFEDNARVKLFEGTEYEVSGEYDMVLDGKVDDIKSASPYSYDNKFYNYETLAANDDFGYVAQLVGYSTAAEKDLGGWWVINKANGNFKYVPADMTDDQVEQKLDDIKATMDYINNDEPFKRCFDAVPETYRNKESGNMVLCKTCSWCDYKNSCWPNLQQLPSRVYRGKKTPPLVEYVSVVDEEA
jgi:hypothetical protein